MSEQRPTVCFCNGAVTSWYKVLSSFKVLVSGTGRSFGSAPQQKHTRYRQGGRTTKNLFNERLAELIYKEKDTVDDNDFSKKLPGFGQINYTSLHQSGNK